MLDNDKGHAEVHNGNMHSVLFNRLHQIMQKTRQFGFTRPTRQLGSTRPLDRKAMLVVDNVMIDMKMVKDLTEC